MKILLLSQARKIEDQPDYHASFCAAKSGGRQVEVRNVPFIGYIEKYGEDAFYQEVLRQNEDFQPDLVFFQFFHSGGDNGIGQCCKDLKASKNAPLVFGSIGDLFYTGWRKHFARPLPKSALDLAANADAFFATAFGNVADELARYGGKNVIFLPNAFCPEHFPYWENLRDCEREFDVLMLCGKGRLVSRRMVSAIQAQWRRRYVVNELSHQFGDRFAVFGRGWKSSSAMGGVPFKEQVKYYQRSKVVVDAPAPSLTTDYYSSDRLFFMLGSGTPLVYFYTPRFEKMLRGGEHVNYVYRFRDVTHVCKQALSMPADFRMEYAKRIQKFVKERHMISHRVDTIISTAEALQRSRRGEITKEEALRSIRMWHFLPEVDLEREYQFCTRNWVG